MEYRPTCNLALIGQSTIWVLKWVSNGREARLIFSEKLNRGSSCAHFLKHINSSVLTPKGHEDEEEEETALSPQRAMKMEKKTVAGLSNR